MANIILFISVLICFIFHCFMANKMITCGEIFLELYIILLLYFYGLLTSFLNHGTTIQLFKKLDRISMRILFIINLLLLVYLYYKKHHNINLIISLFCILFLSGLFYYCSKMNDVKIFVRIYL
jgi:hypothetical protein